MKPRHSISLAARHIVVVCGFWLWSAACGGESLNAGSNASEGGPGIGGPTGGEACTVQSCNAQSVQSGGGPAACFKGKCAPLITPDCPTVLGTMLIPVEPNTTFVGVLLPRSGPQAAVGSAMLVGVKMALKEYARSGAGGTGEQAAGFVDGVSVAPLDPRVAPRRLIAVVCDDQQDAVRAARHLVDDVGVAVIIGPSDLGQTVSVLSQVSLPAGVATVLPEVNDAALLDLSGRKGLVWQMRGSPPATPEPQRMNEFRGNLFTQFPEMSADGGSPTSVLAAMYAYESVWVAAYGLAVIGATTTPLTGHAFGQGMARLVPPGTRVGCGPLDFTRGMQILASGQNVDLDGVSGPLNWNPDGVP